MCTIIVKDLLKGQTLPQAGNLLYDKMLVEINDNSKVILDMSNVDSLPSIFLNTSIGRYIEDNGYESIKGKLSFKNITSSQANRITDYIKKMVLLQSNKNPLS